MVTAQQFNVTPYLAFYLIIAFVLYMIVYLVVKSSRMNKRKKTEQIMTGIYRTGKVMYEDSVYMVRDILDCRGPAPGKQASKFLVVCKKGDDKLFKLSLDEVSPYNEFDNNIRTLLYK